MKSSKSEKWVAFKSNTVVTEVRPQMCDLGREKPPQVCSTDGFG